MPAPVAAEADREASSPGAGFYFAAYHLILPATSIVLVSIGGWMLGMLVDFTRNIFGRIPALFG